LTRKGKERRIYPNDSSRKEKKKITNRPTKVTHS
jgi:hypothetical protein